MADLNGKSVIVTGASSGIGEATAVYFASKGSSVTLSGRDSGRLQDAVAKCQAAAVGAGYTDSRFLAVTGDVTQASVRDDIVEQTTQTFGKIDVLVSNHAVLTKHDDFDHVTEESFDLTFNVNLKSALFLIKRAVPALESSGGSVVCVSSVASLLPTRQNLFCYGVSKAALDYMVRCLAMELGPRGIRVNSTQPTFVKTRIFRDNLADPDQLEGAAQLFAASTPLKGPERGCEEQTEVIGFLASEASRFVTGQSVAVDGAIVQRGNPFNYA